MRLFLSTLLVLSFGVAQAGWYRDLRNKFRFAEDSSGYSMTITRNSEDPNKLDFTINQPSGEIHLGSVSRDFISNFAPWKQRLYGTFMTPALIIVAWFGYPVTGATGLLPSFWFYFNHVLAFYTFDAIDRAELESQIKKLVGQFQRDGSVKLQFIDVDECRDSVDQMGLIIWEDHFHERPLYKRPLFRGRPTVVRAHSENVCAVPLSDHVRDQKASLDEAFSNRDRM